jgi:ATP-dependent phosphoenolpyruvate carboxykinase
MCSGSSTSSHCALTFSLFSLLTVQAWKDKSAYDAARTKLADMFKANYKKFQKPGVTDYSAHGPQ